MIPKTMCAVLLTGHGGTEKLKYKTDVPVPEPKPQEVLIRVAAAGINNTDINTRIGWYSKKIYHIAVDTVYKILRIGIFNGLCFSNCNFLTNFSY